MKILALDSSAKSASVALTDDEFVLGEFYINTNLTHSQTLVVMIKSLLENTKTNIKDIDAFAVCVGPGSFTGIRIGVSAVKGIAYALDKPCIPVSTLYAMAFNAIGFENTLICATMDARCDQVYNAFFSADENTVTRLTKDSAIKICDLKDYIQSNFGNKLVKLVGDGSNICYNRLSSDLPNLKLLPEHLLYQRAVGVSRAGLCLYKRGVVSTAADLKPSYLRLPQAQRELKKKLKTAN